MVAVTAPRIVKNLAVGAVGAIAAGDQQILADVARLGGEALGAVAAGLAAVVVLDDGEAFARAIQVILDHAVALALAASHHHLARVNALEPHPIEAHAVGVDHVDAQQVLAAAVAVLGLVPHAAGDELEIGRVTGRAGGGSGRRGFCGGFCRRGRGGRRRGGFSRCGSQFRRRRRQHRHIGGHGDGGHVAAGRHQLRQHPAAVAVAQGHFPPLGRAVLARDGGAGAGVQAVHHREVYARPAAHVDQRGGRERRARRSGCSRCGGRRGRRHGEGGGIGDGRRGGQRLRRGRPRAGGDRGPCRYCGGDIGAGSGGRGRGCGVCCNRGGGRHRARAKGQRGRGRRRGGLGDQPILRRVGLDRARAEAHVHGQLDQRRRRLRVRIGGDGLFRLQHEILVRVGDLEAVDGVAGAVEAAAGAVLRRNARCVGAQLRRIGFGLTGAAGSQQEHDAEPQRDPGQERLESLVGGVAVSGCCGACGLE